MADRDIIASALADAFVQGMALMNQARGGNNAIDLAEQSRLIQTDPARFQTFLNGADQVLARLAERGDATALGNANSAEIESRLRRLAFLEKRLGEMARECSPPSL